MTEPTPIFRRDTVQQMALDQLAHTLQQAREDLAAVIVERDELTKFLETVIAWPTGDNYAVPQIKFLARDLAMRLQLNIKDDTVTGA